MAKRLGCVIERCTASIEAETGEATARAQERASEAHPDVELDDETVAQIRSQIRDV